MSLVYLGLGSNLGDRLDNLRQAVEALPPAVKPVALSTVYETPPWGFLEQPVFLNQVIGAETCLEPQMLLSYLKNLEIKMGRQPSVQYGPRLIDIDILLYGDLVLDSPKLVIPHPRLVERPFVLVPLVDLTPNLRHPVSGLSMVQLLDGLDASRIKPYVE